jgi:hypothetical protein
MAKILKTICVIEQKKVILQALIYAKEKKVISKILKVK